MNEQRLRWRWRRILRDIDIHPPAGVTELCRGLGRLRGRELRLMPYKLAIPGPFGVWFETDDFDVIVFQQETTKAHQDHIILHEVGHIVANHGGDSTSEENSEILPQVPIDSVRRRLRRTCYDVRNEYEAEVIASLIGTDFGLLRPPLVEKPAASPSAAMSRVESAMTYRPGWWQ